MVHPLEVGQILADIMPNAELMVFEDGEDMYRSIHVILGRVREFLLS